MTAEPTYDLLADALTRGRPDAPHGTPRQPRLHHAGHGHPATLTGRGVTRTAEARTGGLSVSRRYPPLDVLIVTSEAPPIVSGISRCIERLDTGLTARGAGVDVLSAVQIPRLTLGEWRLSSFAAHWPKVARRLAQVDVVNVHGPVPTMSDVFLRMVDAMPEHARPAVVYTYHSPIDIRGLKPLCAVYNKVHHRLSRRADRIVASSPYYARAHASTYGPQSEAIPWGVDPFDAAGSRIAVPKRHTGPLKVLFVGQMRPYKGVETLLQAVAGLPEVDVTLVGSGARLDEYRSMAVGLGARNARFTGRVSDEQLRAEYAAADVIVLPSVTQAEAFGLVLLEGMAAGAVPVASALPGVSDVAGPTGEVVTPGDAAALRASLAGLAADRNRLAALQVASKERAEVLSWDRCVDAYYDVFVSAAQRRWSKLHGGPHPRFGGPA